MKDWNASGSLAQTRERLNGGCIEIKLNENRRTFSRCRAQASELLAFQSSRIPVKIMESKLKTNLGWRSRGYLPHYDGGEVSQFVTARLFDSLPQNVLNQWRVELEKEEITDIEFRKKIEYYLDQNYGECFLKDERVAEIVQENLLFHEGKKYKLYAWVVMPNHIHYLLTPIAPHTLAEITHSNKSFTAHAANKILKRSGKFWFHESFDRYIRDEKHFLQTTAYIENNPVKAGLCEKPSDWKFSSAFGK